MRIAILADIHGNLRALEAVLASVRQQGADLIVNLGDCVSGPLEARQTADLLMSETWLTVRGNHDRMLIEKKPADMGGSDRYAHAQLQPRHLEWLAGLPPELSFEDLYLCHGSPGNDTAYLFEEIDATGRRLALENVLLRRVEGIAARVILCGHSHMLHAARLEDGRLLVNPGSVGLPAYDFSKPWPHVMESGAPHARYAILQRRHAEWEVTFHAVNYDWKAAASDAEARGRQDWSHALRTGLALR
jgi:putative phosphoesterase